MKYQIFRALDRNFVKKLFLKNRKIESIKIEKTSPFWAKESCLLRYKISFDKNNQKIIRGTAKIHGSGKKTWQIMKYLYSQGFDKKPLSIVKPIDFVDEINLILYEETTGQTLTEILQSETARISEAAFYLKGAAAWLSKLHNLAVPKINLRKAFFLGSKEYEKIFDKIKKIMPELKDYLVPARNLKIIDKIWQSEKNTLIHNDFYPGNIIVTKRNFYGIDFDRAGFGPPLMDVATLYGSLDFPKEIWRPNFSKKEIKHLQKTFLKTYCRLTEADYATTRKKVKKFLAKIYLDQVHYHTNFAAKGWSFMDTLAKKSSTQKIKALLLKI